MKYLIIHGPQRYIFKELQRIQAIDFHQLGQKLTDIKVARSASTLSTALQVAVSRDVVMADQILIEYDGPLLKEYVELLTPEHTNIMLVSSTYPQEMMTEEEPFLNTKFIGSGS
jgi:secreted Zn-dependent insulinase-like peptidase